MRISTSCGSEGSGNDSPAVRNVVEVVRKRVFRSPDFNHLPAWDLRWVRATRRTIFDYAAACPSRLVVSPRRGWQPGKTGTSICTRRPPCAVTGKQGNLFTEKNQKGEP